MVWYGMVWSGHDIKRGRDESEVKLVGDGDRVGNKRDPEFCHGRLTYKFRLNHIQRQTYTHTQTLAHTHTCTHTQLHTHSHTHTHTT